MDRSPIVTLLASLAAATAALVLAPIARAQEAAATQPEAAPVPAAETPAAETPAAEVPATQPTAGMPAVPGAAKPWFERFRPSALLYTEWMAQISPAGGSGSAFDVTRAILELRGDVDDAKRAEYRFSQDVARRSLLNSSGTTVDFGTSTFTTSSNQYVGTNLKYAYVTLNDLAPVKVALGLQPRPWVNREDEFRVTRYIAPQLMDVYKYDGSGDLGLSLIDECPNSDWVLMLSNGEGDKKPETGAHKDVAFRYTWAANDYKGKAGDIRGFHISVGAVYGFANDRHGDRSRVQLLLGSRGKDEFSWAVGLYQMTDEANDVAGFTSVKTAIGGTATAHGGAAQLFFRIPVCPKTCIYAELAYVDPVSADDAILAGQSNPGTALRGIAAFEYMPFKGTTIAFVYLAEQRKGTNVGTAGIKVEVVLK